jgi:hypothetical protein
MQDAAAAVDKREEDVLEYSYNSRTRKWDVSKEVYQIENKVWATGGHRRCNRCWRKGSDGMHVFKQYLKPVCSEQVRVLVILLW